MKYSVLILCFALFLGHKMEAQNSEQFYSYKNEIGTNVTSLLGNMLSLLPPSNVTPYGLSYARHFKKYTFRISADAFYDQQITSEFDGINFVERTLTDQSYNLKVAFERHYDISRKFQFHYGLDALTTYSNSFSTTSTNFANDVTQYTYGGGPAFRIFYKINQRLTLMTEASLYGSLGTKSFLTSLNGQTVVDKSNAIQGLKLTVPSVLYLFVNF